MSRAEQAWLERADRERRRGTFYACLVFREDSGPNTGRQNVAPFTQYIPNGATRVLRLELGRDVTGCRLVVASLTAHHFVVRAVRFNGEGSELVQPAPAAIFSELAESLELSRRGQRVGIVELDVQRIG